MEDDEVPEKHFARARVPRLGLSSPFIFPHRWPVFLWAKKTSREEQFHNGCRGHSLPDPKKEHPFDNLGFEAVHFRADFRLEFYSILFGHEPLGEVILLIAERNL
jgi:hypothetical protein